MLGLLALPPLFAQSSGRRAQGAMTRLRARVKGLEAQVATLQKLVLKQGQLLRDLHRTLAKPAGPLARLLGADVAEHLEHYRAEQKRLATTTRELGKGQPGVQKLARQLAKEQRGLVDALLLRRRELKKKADKEQVAELLREVGHTGDLDAEPRGPHPFYVVPVAGGSEPAVWVFVWDARSQLYLRQRFQARAGAPIGGKRKVGRRTIDFTTGATLLSLKREGGDRCAIRFKLRNGEIASANSWEWPEAIRDLR